MLIVLLCRVITIFSRCNVGTCLCRGGVDVCHVAQLQQYDVNALKIKAEYNSSLSTILFSMHSQACGWVEAMNTWPLLQLDSVLYLWHVVWLTMLQSYYYGGIVSTLCFTCYNKYYVMMIIVQEVKLLVIVQPCDLLTWGQSMVVYFISSGRVVTTAKMVLQAFYQVRVARTQ